MTHQGYKNYETFSVAVWIDNTRGPYDDVTGHAEDVITEALEEEEERGEIVEAHVGEFAEWLKTEYVEELKPEDLDPPFSDLLAGALSEVDWYELAKGWLDEALTEHE